MKIKTDWNQLKKQRNEYVSNKQNNKSFNEKRAIKIENEIKRKNIESKNKKNNKKVLEENLKRANSKEVEINLSSEISNEYKKVYDDIFSRENKVILFNPNNPKNLMDKTFFLEGISFNLINKDTEKMLPNPDFSVKKFLLSIFNDDYNWNSKSSDKGLDIYFEKENIKYHEKHFKIPNTNNHLRLYTFLNKEEKMIYALSIETHIERSKFENKFSYLEKYGYKITRK